LHLHLTRLLTSLYILAGGGVNEVLLRVDALRRLAPTLNSPVVGLTHLAVQISFSALVGYFNGAALLRTRVKLARRQVTALDRERPLLRSLVILFTRQ
jgi:hypothetical protein